MRSFACAAVLVAAIACGNKDKPKPDWKPRSGPGFTIVAPFEPIVTTRPIAPGIETKIYEYGGLGALSLQVTAGPLPKGRHPFPVVQMLRDNVAKVSTIVDENDIPLGDTFGKDVRYKTRHPDLGDVSGHARIVVFHDVVYQITALRSAAANASEADADKFVESFKFPDDAKPVAPKIVSGEPDAKGWYAARSTTGFSLRAPGPISEQTFEDAGKKFDMLMTVKQPERIKYAATCIVMPTAPTERDVVGDGRGIQSRRERDVNGRKGVEFDVDNNASILVVFDGTRVCMVGVTPYVLSTPRPVEDAKAFFDSFAFD
jgi:hypothetical protein